MKKRTICLCLMLALLLSLAACAKSEPAAQDAEKTPTVETTTPAAETPQEETPKENEELEPYTIGVYATLTGSGASTGDQQCKGMEVALKEINDAGGVQGHKLETIVYDDAGSPEAAVSAVTRLIESDGVSVIAGGNLSPNIIATKDLTEEAHVLQVGLGTGATWTNCGAKYLFRATTNATLPIGTFVDLMLQVGEETTALISLESEYGQSGRQSILDALEGTGIELVAEATYQTTETDFTGHVSRLMAADPDSIIMYGNGWEMALILKQLRQQGFDKCVYTCEGGANTDILEVAGSSADGLAFGCAYIVPVDIEHATSDVERNFLEKYVELHGEMPLSDVAYRAYDQIRLIGIALNNSADIYDKEANRDAFAAIDNYDGLAGHFDFTDESGDGLTKSNAYMVMDCTNQSFDLDTFLNWRNNK